MVVAGKEGDDFFRGRGRGCNFLTKNKPKSGIFNDKNFKNSNWKNFN